MTPPRDVHRLKAAVDRANEAMRAHVRAVGNNWTTDAHQRLNELRATWLRAFTAWRRAERDAGRESDEEAEAVAA